MGQPIKLLPPPSHVDPFHSLLLNQTMTVSLHRVSDDRHKALLHKLRVGVIFERVWGQIILHFLVQSPFWCINHQFGLLLIRGMNIAAFIQVIDHVIWIYAILFSYNLIIMRLHIISWFLRQNSLDGWSNHLVLTTKFIGGLIQSIHLLDHVLVYKNWRRNTCQNGMTIKRGHIKMGANELIVQPPSANSRVGDIIQHSNKMMSVS